MSHPEPTSSPEAQGAAPSGPYLSRLEDKDRESFQCFTGTNDLTTEIRLIRTMLARLCGDIPGNWRAIGSIFTVLLRAITLQNKRSSGISELEQALTRAAEEVLDQERNSDSAP